MTHLYADDDYLDYYQFEHDPFSDHRASFKFFSAKRQSVLVEMQHIARYSNLMLVVTGPQGSGKTVLRFSQRRCSSHVTAGEYCTWPAGQ